MPEVEVYKSTNKYEMILGKHSRTGVTREKTHAASPPGGWADGESHKPGYTRVFAPHKGWCLGLSVLWSKHMLDTEDAASSRPDVAKAGAIQWIYAWTSAKAKLSGVAGADEAALALLLKEQSLATEPRVRPTVSAVAALGESGNLLEVLRSMAHNRGTYLICSDVHATAAHVGAGGFYYYDANDGCFAYPDCNGNTFASYLSRRWTENYRVNTLFMQRLRPYNVSAVEVSPFVMAQVRSIQMALPAEEIAAQAAAIQDELDELNVEEARRLFDALVSKIGPTPLTMLLEKLEKAEKLMAD